MDGRVAAIRDALDDRGYESTPILAYAAKYASAFYGPFREAAGSAPSFGDRRGYQMDPANVREALRECELDVEEGADAIMIKPALPYLDVIRAAREAFDLPIGGVQRLRRVRDGQGGRARRAGSTSGRPRSSRSPRSGAPAPTSSSATGRRTSPRGSDDAQRALSPRARAHPRRCQLAGARDAGGRPRRAVLRRARRRGVHRGRRRQPAISTGCMSWGPLLFGHADPETVEAVREAALRGTSFGAPTEAEVELAAEIADAVPSVEQVRLVSSGTEAAMSALRLARGFTKRDRILKFAGCYHGHVDALLASAGSGLATLGDPVHAGRAVRRRGATRSSCPYNDLDAAAEAVVALRRGPRRDRRRAGGREHGRASRRPTGSSRGCARSATRRARCSSSTR